MIRNIINRAWYCTRKNEYYARLAHHNNLKSRAWYKIMEINKRYKIFKLNFNILEIGCSPGGWSKYISSKIGKGNIICFDKENIVNNANVSFFKCDINDIITVEKNIIYRIKKTKFDVIVSDICGNFSGIRIIDMNYHVNVLNKICYLCNKFLSHNGTLVSKIFNGIEFKEYLIDINNCFKRKFLFKPNASLSSSTELYCIAKNYIF